MIMELDEMACRLTTCTFIDENIQKLYLNLGVKNFALKQTQEEIQEAKKQSELDRKLRTMIREVLWQLILLALMLWVAVGNRDVNVYLQNAHLKHIFVDELPEVSADVIPRKWMFSLNVVLISFVYVRTDLAQTSSSGWRRS